MLLSSELKRITISYNTEALKFLYNVLTKFILINSKFFLSLYSESEASGSARVTPVQQRRRQVPSKHPHRRGRKVSAPPELQPHLGPHPAHNLKKHSQGGAITDSADSSTSPQEYIISINSGNNNGE